MKNKPSNFNVRVEYPLKVKLDYIATREDKSTAQIVRVAIRAFCDQKRLPRLRQISQWRD